MADNAVEEISLLEASDNAADGFATQDMAVANGHDDTNCDEGVMIT